MVYLVSIYLQVFAEQDLVKQEEEIQNYVLLFVAIGVASFFTYLTQVNISTVMSSGSLLCRVFVMLCIYVFLLAIFTSKLQHLYL